MANAQQSMTVGEPSRTGISRNLYILTIAVVMVIGFVAGTRSNELLGAIAPVFGFKVETGSLDLASVQDTYRQLKANYDGTLNTEELINGANRGLVAAAGDQYTVFMDAKEATDFDNDLTGQIGGGIGAEIGVRHDQPTVVRVIADNPADKAGVKAGDVIVAINDQPAAGWTAEKTAAQIRGEIGTTVKIELKRGEELNTVTITRASVTNPSVQSTVREGLGILTITRFDSETGTLARRAAETFKEQGVKGVILDLRDNGGGYLDEAQSVAGLWLDNQVVVTERVNGKVTEERKSGSNPVLNGLPTVVLVNTSSASASEIVAGALQDHKAATLVGEKTFGKGTVQKVIDLGAGTQLKVTVARWYTPDGKNITKEGISPNQIVELTAENVNSGQDPQLDAARARLNG